MGLNWRVATAQHTLRRFTFVGVNKEGMVSITKPIKKMYGSTVFETHGVEAKSIITINEDVEVWVRWTERLHNVALKRDSGGVASPHHAVGGTDLLRVKVRRT